MSTRPAVVYGTLKPDGTLELDQKPDLPAGRVRVVLHSEEQPAPGGHTIIDTLDRIHREQRARGYQGLSEEEMEAVIRELREASDDDERWRQIYEQTTRPLPKEERP